MVPGVRVVFSFLKTGLSPIMRLETTEIMYPPKISLKLEDRVSVFIFLVEKVSQLVAAHYQLGLFHNHTRESTGISPYLYLQWFYLKKPS